MLVRDILLAVYDTSALPYTKRTGLKETVVKDERDFFFSPTDNIYIWIDQTPSLEMQLGYVSLFWRLWLL